MQSACRAALLAGLLLALAAHATLPDSAPELELDADDACSGDGEGDAEECGLSLRQLRGELQAAEVKAHSAEDGGDEGADGGAGQEDEVAEAGGDETDLFTATDADGSGEVQHAEAVGLLERLGDHGAEQMQAMFRAQDKDASQGLSAQEFADAADAWGMTCASARRSYFCLGTRRTCCCRNRYGLWATCGCRGRVYSCR